MDQTNYWDAQYYFSCYYNPQYTQQPVSETIETPAEQPQSIFFFFFFFFECKQNFKKKKKNQ